MSDTELARKPDGSGSGGGTTGGSSPSAAVEELRDAATTKAKDVSSDVRQQLRSQADEQTVRVSGVLRELSGQLSSMADASGADGLLGDATHDAADRVRSLADRLDQGGLDRALDDVKRFARNRPALFLTVAAGAGALVGRLVRSTDVPELAEAARSTAGSPGSSTGASSTGAAAPSAGPGAIPPGGDPAAVDPSLAAHTSASTYSAGDL
jgi:hypothetical protein